MVLLCGIISLIAAFGLTRLKEEEDLMVFLPTTDPDVTLFREVAKRFGAMRVALIGVETPAGEDIFVPATVKKLKAATDAIKNVRGVDRVVSMTSVADVQAGPAGAEVANLVAEVPETAAEGRALKAKVMAREHIVGNMVSKDGRAALILVFLAEGLSDRVVTSALRAAADQHLSPLARYYGGAPFAGVTIYQEAQADVWKLSPIAVLVLLLVVVLSFRDIVGVVLTVVSVAFSVLVVLGGMGLWGEKFTVASSTLPVILFASGSSYAVHVLGRYYLLRGQGRPATEAIHESLRITGAPLLIAALTTSVGFFSFVATDVRPMRAFGIACGMGVIICWLTSLTLVPSVVALWPRKGAPKQAQLHGLGEIMVRLWNRARLHRVWVVVGSLAAAAVLVAPMFRVKVRMEPRAFFRVGSEPWQAERFLEERFGGAHFVQIAVRGDLDDPATLRELERLNDYARSLPGVSQVQAITGPMRLVNEVMGGGRRLPSTAPQAANLYFFLEGEVGMGSLIAAGRRESLMHVRVRGDARPVVDALERYAKETLRQKPERPTSDDVADRIGWIIKAVTGSEPRDPARLKKTLKVIAAPGDNDAEWIAKSGEVARAYVASDEAPPMSGPARAALVQAVMAGPVPVPVDGGWKAKLIAQAPSPEEGGLAAGNLLARLEDARRDLAVGRALPLALDSAGLGGAGPELAALLATQLNPVLDDLFIPALSTPPKEPMSARVAGEPILDRGFSRSVERNQLRSLGISIVCVYLMMLGLFRSLYQAFVCLFPSLLTLVAIFGVMGIFGVHIDLGTSLVAGIATGAGADFAMHYMWYLRRESPDAVTRSVGPVMVVSILLVSFGFVVLAFGRSPVMRLFGSLAGLSMSLSAFLTCLLVPALLNKFVSDPGPKTRGGPHP